MKYKVRPSTGTLIPQESIKVTFVLNGMSIKQTDVMRDKFLVLVIPVIDTKDMAEMWKVFLIYIYLGNINKNNKYLTKS